MPVAAGYHSVGYTYEETATSMVFAGTSIEPGLHRRHGNPTVSLRGRAGCAGGEAAGVWLRHGRHPRRCSRRCAGTTVVAAHDIYGATYAPLARLLAIQGVSVRFVTLINAAVAATLADVISGRQAAGCAAGGASSRTCCSRWPTCPGWPNWRTRTAPAFIDNTLRRRPLPSAGAGRRLRRPQRDEYLGAATAMLGGADR